MDKSSTTKCLLYSDVVKGEPCKSHRKRTKKKLWRKRQSRSWRFSFHKYFTAFYIYFFFSITLLYHFFSLLFLPTTFTHTHTHDPRRLPTTHDPRLLATLFYEWLCRISISLYYMPHTSFDSMITLTLNI